MKLNTPLQLKVQNYCIYLMFIGQDKKNTHRFSVIHIIKAPSDRLITFH